MAYCGTQLYSSPVAHLCLVPLSLLCAIALVTSSVVANQTKTLCGHTCPQECPLSSILTSIWPKMSHKCTLCSLQQHKYLLNFWHRCFFLKLSNSLNCSQNKRFSLSRKGQNNLMGFSKSGLGTVIVTKCFPSYRQMLSLRKHISDINCTEFLWLFSNETWNFSCKQISRNVLWNGVHRPLDP